MIPASNALARNSCILVQHSATAIVLNRYGETILLGPANFVEGRKLMEHGRRRGMLLTQISQSIRRICNNACQFRTDFTDRGLPDQEIHYNTVIRAVECRTENT